MKKKGVKLKIFYTLILVIVLFLCFDIISVLAIDETSTTEVEQEEK